MKRPPCKNWDGTRCELDLFGGRPSPGTCETCDHYDGAARGLGDRVERALKATGIHQVAKAWRPSCGCSDRRNKLNKFGKRSRA